MLEIAHGNTVTSAAGLASALNLDRTIVHRLLRTLEGEELVVQTPRGYAIGPKALLLGNAYLETLRLRRVALPYQVQLHTRLLDENPWVVSLLIPIGDEVALIDTIWSKAAPLDILTELGTRFPIATSAVGRCVLAYREPSAVDSLVGEDLASELMPILEQIRTDNGMAFIEDYVPGVGAAAAAIFNRSREVVGGLLLSGLNMDEQLNVKSDASQQLRRAADGIGDSLER